PAGAGARGLAARRDRAREHARRLRRADPRKAAPPRSRAGDRHGARRGVPARMKPLGIRRRLLLAVLCAVAAALVTTIGAFNLLLGHQLSRDASRLPRDRAAGPPAPLPPPRHRPRRPG